MLRVEGLTFAYRSRRGRHTVFDNLNVEFVSGMNVILGPNGAGKSTLLKSIFGLLDYRGRIYYGDRHVTAMDTEDKTRLMSYLPQMDIESSMLTVFEMVLLGRLPELGHRVPDKDLNVVTETLEALNIMPLAKRNFGELSGGQKKLVFIAQTLARQPRLILLDEPVNSLDLQKQLELCQLLNKIVGEKNVDIIVVMHDINLAARYARNLVIIDGNGSFHSQGAPRDVITSEMLRDVYGVVADVTVDASGLPVVSPLRSVRSV